MIWYNERQQSSERQHILEGGDHDKPCLPIQLRVLVPDDIYEVKALCEDSFPIDYPISWYEDITSTLNSKFYSIAAIYNAAIVGILVAEIGKPYSKLNKEDKTILSENSGRGNSLAYILSLGVHRKYRRNGIGESLLTTFIEHLQQEQNSKIKAIYLHVLTTNKPAIMFYEKFSFKLHSFLPYYYSIKGKSKDGFCYVHYTNGGSVPKNFFIDYMQIFCRNILKFNLLSWISSRVRNILNCFNYGWLHNKIHYFRQ